MILEPIAEYQLIIVFLCVGSRTKTMMLGTS